MTLTSVPPTSDRSRLDRMRAPAAVIGGLGLASLALHLRDPHVEGSWGLCPSAAWFGVWCPGCGGLRAVNDLTHGDVVAAASSNLAFVVVLPFLLLGLAVWTLDRWRGRERSVPPRAMVAAGVVVAVGVVVFTVLRNLAAGSWLAP